MTDIIQSTLGELKEAFTQKLEYWNQQKLEHEQEVERCRREIEALENKLRHVEALFGSSSGPKGAVAGVLARRKTRRRIRQSPVKMATLLALRNRLGESLNTRQILAAIRDDLGKRVSRQSVNVNLGLLEEEGRVRKQPAPKGSGARFVYSAVPET